MRFLIGVQWMQRLYLTVNLLKLNHYSDHLTWPAFILLLPDVLDLFALTSLKLLNLHLHSHSLSLPAAWFMSGFSDIHNEVLIKQKRQCSFFFCNINILTMGLRWKRTGINVVQFVLSAELHLPKQTQASQRRIFSIGHKRVHRDVIETSTSRCEKADVLHKA